MITRLAPSPTGPLHLGHVRAYLAAWLWARAAGGRVALRIEDLDAPRTLPGAADGIVRDLQWLGLDWEERSPDQGTRSTAYLAALERLNRAGHLYACTRSRQELLTLASAPHGPEGHPPFPKAWRRDEALPSNWPDALGLDAAIRFKVPEGVVYFEDACQGIQNQNVLDEVGDFVLRRRDGVFAYQLACVVDDAAQGITHVVRGEDLLFSTARQIQLHQALGTPVPTYAHVGLVVNAQGEKLSKRDGVVSIAMLREMGTTAGEILSWAAGTLGITGKMYTITDLIGQLPEPHDTGKQVVFNVLLPKEPSNF